MRLSRMDLFPVLTIVAGGLVGGLVSFSFLGQSRSDDVSVPGWQPETEPDVFVMPVIEQSVQSSSLQPVGWNDFFGSRADHIAIVSDRQAVVYRDGETGQSYVVGFTDEEQAAFERIEVFERRVGYVRERVAELLRDGDISN